MGIFDKAKDMAAEHTDQIDQGIEKGGDMIDEKTDGKYAAHVDQGQELAKDKLGGYLGGESDKPAE